MITKLTLLFILAASLPALALDFTYVAREGGKPQEKTITLTPSRFLWINSSGDLEILTAEQMLVELGSDSGTVTSVALTAPTQFSVSGSPVIASGTLGLAWANQTANYVLAGPTSGSAAAPAFRGLVDADLPVNPTITGTLTSTLGWSFTEGIYQNSMVITIPLADDSIRRLYFSGSSASPLQTVFYNPSGPVLFQIQNDGGGYNAFRSWNSPLTLGVGGGSQQLTLGTGYADNMGSQASGGDIVLKPGSGGVSCFVDIRDAANAIWISASGIIAEGSAADSYEGTIAFTNVTADRVWTLPDSSGTIAVTETKADTGDYGSGNFEGRLVINSFDNSYKVYAAGAWRTIASW